MGGEGEGALRQGGSVLCHLQTYTSVMRSVKTGILTLQWNLSTTGLQRAARLLQRPPPMERNVPYTYHVLKTSISGPSLLRPTAMKRVPRRSITIALCLQQRSKAHPLVNHTLNVSLHVQIPHAQVIHSVFISR